jgi:hypothetical protein
MGTGLMMVVDDMENFAVKATPNPFILKILKTENRGQTIV